MDDHQPIIPNLDEDCEGAEDYLPQNRSLELSSVTDIGNDETNHDGCWHNEHMDKWAPNNSLYKTELCCPFEETGACKYGKRCQFAHGQKQMRPLSRHPKYKTQPCRAFHTTGFCPYGSRCHFIHNENLCPEDAKNWVAEEGTGDHTLTSPIIAPTAGGSRRRSLESGGDSPTSTIGSGFSDGADVRSVPSVEGLNGCSSPDHNSWAILYPVSITSAFHCIGGQSFNLSAPAYHCQSVRFEPGLSYILLSNGPPQTEAGHDNGDSSCMVEEPSLRLPIPTDPSIYGGSFECDMNDDNQSIPTESIPVIQPADVMDPMIMPDDYQEELRVGEYSYDTGCSASVDELISNLTQLFTYEGSQLHNREQCANWKMSFGYN